MNRSRRRFTLATGSILVGLLSGCAEMASKDAETEYVEYVSSVMISKDGKYIVVLGDRHFYVFKAPPTLVKTLKSTFHRSVSGEFGEFIVKDSILTSGPYKLILSKAATEQEKRESIDAGFTEAPDGSVSFQGTLTGVRRETDGMDMEVQLPERLNKTYRVSVKEYPKDLADSANESATFEKFWRDFCSSSGVTPGLIPRAIICVPTYAFLWALVVAGVLVLLPFFLVKEQLPPEDSK